MAKESVKILQGKLDVKSLIDQLNAALSEEWLAYYQYWVGALVVEGAMRADVQGEFEEHAEEERHHAQLIADRIIELEGVPVLDPKKWFELARCKYDSPTAFTPPEAVSSFYCLSPYNNFSFTPRLYSNIHILYVATVTKQKTMRLMG